MSKNERLEDFGVRSTLSPLERFQELKRQKLDGKQWMAVLAKDPEVARLACFKKVKSR